MKRIFFVLALLLSFGMQMNAQNVITIKDGDLVGNTTYTWTNDNEYLIDGFVYLEEGGVLNIQAGTVIRGKESPTTGDQNSSLIITRGAQIFAEGTPSQPIIFTAEIDDLNDPTDLGPLDNELWGGLLLLGRANVTDETCEVAIEGIPAGDPRAFYGVADCNFINDDNSGVLRYVSIRHGGAEIGAGNEINGLTLGAVGSGTTIEYIEVFANFDDGIEWFGGTVDVKYACVAFCGDESYDWDTGWLGKGQFWFAIQGDNADNGAEMDGAKPDANTPPSNPTVYNATYIGSGLGSPASNPHALVFQDGTAGTYSNSIFTDYANFAILVEDRAAANGLDSRQRMEQGELNLRNNLWWNFGQGSELNAGSNGFINVSGDAEDPTAQFLIDHLIANNNAVANPQLTSISRTANGNALDPRPAAGSPAFNNLDSYPSDPFFTPVNYKGAFGNALWVRGWTALDAYGYLPTSNCITIKDGDLQGNTTYNWTADNCYLLDGFVYLEEGGVLNIEAGTVIRGKESPTTGDQNSSLIITRGAQIFAEGTKDNPIIFTAELDDLNDPTDLTPLDNELWGGLLLLGRANVTDETCEVAIEGIPAGDPRAFYGVADCNFINDDNSGVLRYVSIRHGGAEIGAGNEINGLTLGAVGSGTTIEYIEVFANFDDGIEWFGGTVDVKYACVAFCGDESYDWDTGWLGKGQFWFAIQGDNADNGAEMDGAKPDAGTPPSNPTVYNATYIGSGLGSPASNPHALVFQDGTAGTYANSIFTDYANFAILVEDRAAANGLDSRQRMEQGELNLRNNLWWNFGSGSELNAGANGIINVSNDAEDPTAQFLINHLVNNGNELANPAIGNISREADGTLDPRPGAIARQNLAALPNDPFFTPAFYKGAFCTDGGVWIKGWTALSQNGYLNNFIPDFDPSCGVVSTNVVEANGFALEQSIPNPVSDRAQIKFELPAAANITMTVTDIAGREVARLIDNQMMTAGEYSVDFDATRLPNGMYFYSLRTGNVILTKSLVIGR